jgi:hypothetical protein
MTQAGIEPRPSRVGGKHSRKEPFKELFSCYSEHLHVSTRPQRVLMTWLPSQCMCYMNIYEHMNCTRMKAEWHLQVSVFNVKQDNPVRVTSMKILDQVHLHPKLEVLRLTCPGRESNLGLCGGRRAI